MKTQYLCFPLNTKPTTTTITSSSSPTSSTTTNGRVSPPGSSSLLDRFREAVFRLIMATALSKANNNSTSSSSSSSSTLSSSSRLSTKNYDYRHNNSSSNNNHGHESVRRSCYLYDPYHNEALADCIEFIKKKSASSSPSDRIRLHDEIDGGDDDYVNTRGSTVSDVDVVIPLPVM